MLSLRVRAPLYIVRVAARANTDDESGESVDIDALAARLSKEANEMKASESMDDTGLTSSSLDAAPTPPPSPASDLDAEPASSRPPVRR